MPRGRLLHSRRFAARGEAASVELGNLAIIGLGVMATAIGAAIFVGKAVEIGDESKGYAEGASQVSGLDVVQAYFDSTSGTPLLVESVTTAPGVDVADLRSFRLTLELGTKRTTLVYGAEAGAGVFTAEALRDADGSFSIEEPVLNRGDLVQITIHLAANDLTLQPKAILSQTLQAEKGVAAYDRFEIPLTIGENRIVRLTSATDEQEASA